ncbi:LysR family transcriptional regulator [Rhodobium gokarnense]|uniref:DNA-binding transcriptional LysR family regulator n=1 Tax=Rhodobium gokarnense TaxID=364296 RepID=A0ABT3HG43_9HYPH|nr:LysR family transcriptional regulator [Rhodobium gokarnense]MCW2309370.1 DNA-binding transcriptional LysR family regulator [Rhodobium gokarnense]
MTYSAGEMRSKRPSPHTLNAFEAAARLGSFSKAAAELGVTQPAVSRAIAALEAEVGEQLFQRSGPNVQLTPKGAELSTLLSDAFTSLETLFARWRANRDRGSVLLSISSSMATHWLIPRLFDFRQLFPNVDLRFELIAGAIGSAPITADLGLRRVEPGQSAEPDSLYVPEIIQPIASPEYLRRMGPLGRTGARRPHTLITLSNHWCDWPKFAAESGLALPKEFNEMQFSDYSVALESAINGQGVVLGWLSVTSRLIRMRKLVGAADAAYSTGATYNLITNSAFPPSDLVRKVRAWMQKEVRAELEAIEKSERLFAAACNIALATT